MLVSWVYFRIWFFPVHVICRILEEIETWPEETFSINIALMTVGFLIALACMHVFWLYIMIKGIIKRLRCQNRAEAISLGSRENRLN